MSDVWYPRYVGDYQRKTGHLSLMEHGAYSMLLDHYYATGGLPANAEQLHRICRAVAAVEQAAVQNVVEQFFRRDGDRLVNEKAEEELAKRRAISEKRSNAAEARHARARANADASAGANDHAFAHTTTTTTTYKEERAKALPPQAARFGEFWDSYPHRDGRKRDRSGAEKKYRAHVKAGVPEQAILDGLARLRDDKRVKDGFARDPVTWLNQRGWEDEPASSQPAPSAKPTPTSAQILDNLERAYRSRGDLRADLLTAEAVEGLIARGVFTRELAASRGWPLAAAPIRKPEDAA